MAELRWGILATGGIARAFAAQLPTSATGRLVAVASRDPGRARAFAGEHGATAHGSYEALLADPDVDAVYVATPHPLHAPWTIRAAEAGKHVLCEKPLAMNEAEVAAMIEAAIEHDVFLMEAFMYRCHPQTAAIVHALGRIGEVREVNAVHSFHGGDRLEPSNRLLSRELGGGGILDVGCYCVSGLRLVSDAEVVRIDATGHVGATGVDEWAMATLELADGVVATLSCGIALAEPALLRVRGTLGTIVVTEPWLPGEAFHFSVEHDRGQSGVAGNATRGLYAHQADVVAECVARGERQAAYPASTWSDSLSTARVLDAWRRAIGVSYDADEPSLPVHGGPPRARATMPATTIAGVDVPVSTVVLGTMVTEVPEAYAAGLGVFDAFFERGGTAFDTAHKYGEGLCDDALGRWMETRGVRDRCVVIGKGAHTPHCNPADLTRQLHESLERLRADHLDVYLLHRDDVAVPVGELVDVLDEHHRAGRVRAVGGSNWTAARIDEANAYARANGRVEMTVVSNQLSLARMIRPTFDGTVGANEPDFLAWLAERGHTLIAWSSQAAGFFAGLAEDGPLAHAWFDADNLERRRRVDQLAGELGHPPTTVALAWVLRQPYRVLPIIGPRRLSELRTSLAALDLALTPEQLDWLDLRR